MIYFLIFIGLVWLAIASPSFRIVIAVLALPIPLMFVFQPCVLGREADCATSQGWMMMVIVVAGGYLVYRFIRQNAPL
jgi:hypothetical protein